MTNAPSSDVILAKRHSRDRADPTQIGSAVYAIAKTVALPLGVHRGNGRPASPSTMRANRTGSAGCDRGPAAPHKNFRNTAQSGGTAKLLTIESCRLPDAASQSVCAFSKIASNTGVRSPGEELMTCSTSAVAVCCSSASRVSVMRRAFSIAITACAAKFCSSAIPCLVTA